MIIEAPSLEEAMAIAVKKQLPMVIVKSEEDMEKARKLGRAVIYRPARV